MKASKYNIFWDLDNSKKIAFNSMTCALAEVDDSFFNILNNIRNLVYEELTEEQKELVDNMLLGNYIVKDEINELKKIKFRHFAGKFSEERLTLVIAPTLSCNFACPYCYENPKSGIMNKGIQNAIIGMVDKAAEEKKNIHITWYGGEPLIAKDVLFSMSQKMIEECDKWNVKYTSSIITNGYLINQEIIEKFRKSRITMFQITLDGPPYVHNQRRKLKNCDNGTFDVILNNIKELKANGLENIAIRINTDKTNVNYIEELLDILYQNGLNNLGIDVGHVQAYNDVCASVSEACMDTEEYALEDVKFREIILEKGFNTDKRFFYPGVKTNYCCADSIGSYVIDHEGNMYKCWNEIGDLQKSIGNILDMKEKTDIDTHMNNIDYMLWSPFEYQTCIDCNLLPICMGGCPKLGIKDNLKPKCEKWKYNLEKVIKLTYENKMNYTE